MGKAIRIGQFLELIGHPGMAFPLDCRNLWASHMNHLQASSLEASREVREVWPTFEKFNLGCQIGVSNWLAQILKPHAHYFSNARRVLEAQPGNPNPTSGTSQAQLESPAPALSSLELVREIGAPKSELGWGETI